MSEPIPESIPTSADRRTKRPVKKRALTPVSAQVAQLDALFKNPDKPIELPRSKGPKSLAPPPEIIANVQGSSAGAGSGEFHVYKASRRREYERLRLMDEETEREKNDEVWERDQEERTRRDQEKTGKNRKRREKQKQRKEKQKLGDDEENKKESGTGDDEPRFKKMRPMAMKSTEDRNNRDGAAEDGGAVANQEEIGIIIHDDD